MQNQLLSHFRTRPLASFSNPMLALGFPLLFALLFYGRLLTGPIPISGDMTLFYAPFYSLRWDGGPPLWNPFVAAGMPMDANFQFSAAYPLRWPFYFLSDWRVYFGPYLFLHYMIALAGSFGALRALRLGAVAALAGAVIFACGGYMAARMINSTIFMASCWFPVLIWGAVERRWFGGFIAMGAVAALMLLGSPHLLAYGGIGFVIAWLGMMPRWKVEKEKRSENGEMPFDWRNWLGRWLWIALGILAGLVNILPGALRLSETVRTETTTENNLQDSLRWSEIVPSLFGGAGGPIQPEINDKCLYLGGAAITLILLAAFSSSTWRDRRWWLGIALSLAGLALALGDSVGWQHVLDSIPGLRLLEGPARALVLTAFGLALLAAVGLDSLSSSGCKQRAAASAAVLALVAMIMIAYRANWPDNGTLAGTLRGWLLVPGSLIGRSFTVFNTPASIIPALLVLLLWPVSRPGAACALLALVIVDLRHFEPRVEPHAVAPESFDPPPNIQFLMQERDRSSEPFRIAAIDPLRFHHTEMNSEFKTQYLMSNLATIYGLEDISVFDPLAPLEYKRLFERTAGIPPYNDPIRHLDPERPDKALFAELNVRYLIGNPYDRRLTHLPRTLTPDRPELGVTAWRDAGTTAPLSAWHFVSLIDGQPAAYGEEIGQLVIEADEGTLIHPIRYGIETAHIRESRERLRYWSIARNMDWHRFTAGNSDRFRVPQANYRATIKFDRPLRVRNVKWKLTRRDMILFIPAQAYRLADIDPDWQLVFGDPAAPIYEFLGASPRAELLSTSSNGVNGTVEFRRRSLHRIAVRSRSDSPALLILREQSSPDWRVTVDGRPAQLLRAKHLFRGVELSAGEHDVVFFYRPRLTFALAGLSILALTAGAYWAFRARRCAGRQKFREPPLNASGADDAA